MKIKNFNRFSTNGIAKVGRPEGDNSILYIYEEILFNKGIHIRPISEASFNICYKRYKKLGGVRLFHYHLK